MNERTRFELDSLLALVLGVVFLGTGIAKLAGTGFVAETFGASSFPVWSLWAIGLVELTAAVLVLIPTTRSLGAGTLMAVMAAATSYHVARGEASAALLPLALFAVASAILLMGASMSFARARARRSLD